MGLVGLASSFWVLAWCVGKVVFTVRARSSREWLASVFLCLFSLDLSFRASRRCAASASDDDVGVAIEEVSDSLSPPLAANIAIPRVIALEPGVGAGAGGGGARGRVSLVGRVVFLPPFFLALKDRGRSV